MNVPYDGRRLCSISAVLVGCRDEKYKVVNMSKRKQSSIDSYFSSSAQKTCHVQDDESAPGTSESASAPCTSTKYEDKSEIPKADDTLIDVSKDFRKKDMKLRCW